jgi:hypothetical protein
VEDAAYWIRQNTKCIFCSKVIASLSALSRHIPVHRYDPAILYKELQAAVDYLTDDTNMQTIIEQMLLSSRCDCCGEQPECVTDFIFRIADNQVSGLLRKEQVSLSRVIRSLKNDIFLHIPFYQESKDQLPVKLVHRVLL